MTENQIDMLASESIKWDPDSYFKKDFRILPPPLRRAAYSDRTAFVMASMAHLAYFNFENGKEAEEKFRSLLNSGGFTLLQTFNSADTDTQAFLAKNDEYAVLAFRGTEVSKKMDITTDAKAIKAKVTEGNIHSGFVGAYTSIMEQIKNEIKKMPGFPIYITGHSLGAALATVATRYLENDQIEEAKAPLRDQIAACYTFGSPRVGDELFREKLKSPIYRIVNTRDIVTVVPLLAMGYQHVGDVRFLGTGEGEIQTGIPIIRRTFFFLAAIFKLFGPLVGDHAIVKYRAKLALIAKGRNDELFKNARSGGR
jgi:hypothetical protein